MYKKGDFIQFQDEEGVLRFGEIQSKESFGFIVKSGLETYYISVDDVWGYYNG